MCHLSLCCSHVLLRLMYVPLMLYLRSQGPWWIQVSFVLCSWWSGQLGFHSCPVLAGHFTVPLHFSSIYARLHAMCAPRLSMHALCCFHVCSICVSYVFRSIFGMVSVYNRLPQELVACTTTVVSRVVQPTWRQNGVKTGGLAGWKLSRAVLESCCLTLYIVCFIYWVSKPRVMLMLIFSFICPEV